MIKTLFFVTLLFYAIPGSAAKLEITEAWIKNLPMVVPVRAGYMNISNNQHRTTTIEWLESESFAQIEIHRNVEKDGVSSMRPVHALTIASGETLQLAPGSLHLMMMGPLDKLAPGNKVLVTVGYDDQTTQNIEMIVRK